MNDYISRQMAIYMARDDDMVIMVTAKKEDNYCRHCGALMDGDMNDKR